MWDPGQHMCVRIKGPKDPALGLGRGEGLSGLRPAQSLPRVLPGPLPHPVVWARGSALPLGDCESPPLILSLGQVPGLLGTADQQGGAREGPPQATADPATTGPSLGPSPPPPGSDPFWHRADHPTDGQNELGPHRKGKWSWCQGPGHHAEAAGSRGRRVRPAQRLSEGKWPSLEV